MEERLIKRLALKQHNLEAEVERIAHQACGISKELGLIRTSKIQLENSWNFQLAKAVRQSKLSSVTEQQSMLRYNLQHLNKIKQDLQFKKILEHQQKDKLQKVIYKANLVKQHLQICMEKKKAIDSKREDLKAQSESDSLINLKYVENAALQRSNFSNEAQKTATQFNDEIISVLQELKIDPEIQESIYPTELLSSQSVQFITLNRSENVVNDAPSQKSDLWERAEVAQQYSDMANQTFKIEYLETESGTSLSVDYLPKPGHLFGLHAYQVGSHKIANIQINASNNQDKNSLIEHLEVLEQQAGAKIKII